MKFVEWNSREVFISTQADLWLKICAWPFGLISILYFYRSEIHDAWDLGLAVLITSFFFIGPEVYFTTLFDIDENKIFRNLNFFGFKFFRFEAPIDTSRLVVRYEDGGDFNWPCAAVVTESGKRVRLGCFVSHKKAEMAVKKITKYVPIKSKFE